MTPHRPRRPLSFDLPGQAIVDPIGCLRLLAELAEERLDLASFGASPALARELPSRAMSAPARLSPRGDERRLALIRLTAALFDTPLRDAWLDGALAAGLGGSPERPSDIARVFEPSALPPPPEASARSWVESGLLAFRSARALADFDAALDRGLPEPLLLRSLSRFLPGGSGRGFPGRFSSHESDEAVLRSMIDLGAFARLAPDYLAADPQGFCAALQALMREDEARAARSLPPPASDPAYAQLLQWSQARVDQGVDFLFHGGAYRQSDYAGALARLVADRALPAFHAAELAQSVPQAFKSAPRRSL